MKTTTLFPWSGRGLALLAGLLLLIPCRAEEAAKSNPAAQQLVFENIGPVLKVLVPEKGRGLPIAVNLKCVKASKGAEIFAGKKLRLAYQAPDRLRLEFHMEGIDAILGRDGGDLWMHVPAKKFALQGSESVPRFASRPDSVAKAELDLLKLPVSKDQLALLPALANFNLKPDASGVETVSVQLKPEAAKALKMPAGEIKIRLGGDDRSPDQIGYVDGGFELGFEIESFSSGDDVSADEFKLKPNEGDKVERVASAHIAKFINVLMGSLGSNIPTLPPATGQRKLVATEGKGRLEDWDGTRVLFVKGTPEEMGRQQGTLLKGEIRRVADRILYGVGVGSSFEKGRWFFGEIEECQGRIHKFIDERYLREMDAMAEAAGVEKEEMRLANFFPELFHCSGFALLGKSTTDGKMYHGRVLDYLRGVGLEENAVVMVMQPDQGNAWVNVSYAGFIGSVTAMNEKQISIGEMGGRGEGNWDGKPMAQLLREVMEKASTLDEALAILKKGPRTCEYYYVVADAKTRQAVGIKATPEIFEVVRPGESHPQLAEPVADTVLLSGGDRYTELVRRVKAGYGKFDAAMARDLMSSPVCMNSNIHSVLFCPDTLDFWVANADSANVASHTRYTQYNLKEMLAKKAPAP